MNNSKSNSSSNNQLINPEGQTNYAINISNTKTTSQTIKNEEKEDHFFLEFRQSRLMEKYNKVSFCVVSPQTNEIVPLCLLKKESETSDTLNRLTVEFNKKQLASYYCVNKFTKPKGKTLRFVLKDNCDKNGDCVAISAKFKQKCKQKYDMFGRGSGEDCYYLTEKQIKKSNRYIMNENLN